MTSSTIPLDRESLVTAVSAGMQPRYLFFWGHTAKDATLGKHILSQWWPAQFVVDGKTYPTAEHYMMAEKARMFDDQNALDQIMSAPDPKSAKAIGRKVRGFDPLRWEAGAVDIVVRANAAKFGQNPDLGSWLKATDNHILVEASPVDAVWGIGLAADDPRATNPKQWLGRNLLGFALMRVRGSL